MYIYMHGKTSDVFEVHKRSRLIFIIRSLLHQLEMIKSQT